jgi:hypothetical protein
MINEMLEYKLETTCIPPTMNQNTFAGKTAGEHASNTE